MRCLKRPIEIKMARLILKSFIGKVCVLYFRIMKRRDNLDDDSDLE